MCKRKQKLKKKYNVFLEDIISKELRLAGAGDPEAEV